MTEVEIAWSQHQPDSVSIKYQVCYFFLIVIHTQTKLTVSSLFQCTKIYTQLYWLSVASYRMFGSDDTEQRGTSFFPSLPD